MAPEVAGRREETFAFGTVVVLLLIVFQLVINGIEPQIATFAVFVAVFVVCLEFVFIGKVFLTMNTIVMHLGVLHMIVVLRTRLEILVAGKTDPMSGGVSPVSVVGIVRIELTITAVAIGHLVGRGVMVVSKHMRSVSCTFYGMAAVYVFHYAIL